MQMPAPAGGTRGWQIEQYGPNGPLPHTGAGAVFLCAGRSWGAVDFRRNNGKNIRVRTAILVLFVARQTGARQCCEKITATLYSAKDANLREKTAILRAIRHFYPQIRRNFAQSASANLAATLL